MQENNKAVGDEIAEEADQNKEENVMEEEHVNRKHRNTVVFLKAGDKIELKEGVTWKSAQVTRRGGKATSRQNYDYYNIRKEDDQMNSIHMDKTEWRFAKKDKNEEEVNAVIIPEKRNKKRSANGSDQDRCSVRKREK